MACETGCKLAGLAALVCAAVVVLASAVPAEAQEHAAPAPAAASQAAGAQPASPAGHAASEDSAHQPAAGTHPAAAHEPEGAGQGESHGESPWGFIGKIVNFAILVGTLVYFLRTPFASYLLDRGAQIRRDLETAAQMKDDAGRQIAEIEAQLTRLPGELETLRARGQEEIVAEEARIRETAAAERDRLLDQTRREIDRQLRTARRDLVTHAADLSVQVARTRIERQITSDDQARLVDRYLSQVTHD